MIATFTVYRKRLAVNGKRNAIFKPRKKDEIIPI